MTFTEKRQWERLPVSCEARYCDRESFFVPHKSAQLLDIHHRGCRMLSGSLFERGDIVTIMVNLPVEGLLSMDGMVAWSSPVGQPQAIETGVRFLTYDPSTEETYRKLFDFCLLKNPDYRETFY
ncbi:MAG: PilZ domain-containing protein [Candidatus Omnitrophota bacterium]